MGKTLKNNIENSLILTLFIFLLVLFCYDTEYIGSWIKGWTLFKGNSVLGPSQSAITGLWAVVSGWWRLLAVTSVAKVAQI